MRAGRRPKPRPALTLHGPVDFARTVEGACKHLVKERFNLTGARWRRANIEPVLALRPSMFNEEWEDDWRLEQLQAA